MKIWVDADACPGVVREIVVKAANRHVIETIFVANKSLYLPAVVHISLVLVEQGPDVVDRYIIEHALAGDLAITQDIPLAAELVPNGVITMSPHGTLFDNSNIGERLSVRNLMTDLRDTGMITGGPRPFGDKQKRAFANTFDQVLTKLLRQR